MLRLESDGNMKVYTYYEHVEWRAWDTVFKLFDRDDLGLINEECLLPRRCGSLRVCEDSQCVACPNPWGLMGWSKSWAPPNLPPCKVNNGSNRTGSTGFACYRVEGVDHFLVNDFAVKDDGPMKLGECKEKCDKDCGCLGYRNDSSRCLLAPEIGTLMKKPSTPYVGYIKTHSLKY